MPGPGWMEHVSPGRDGSLGRSVSLGWQMMGANPEATLAWRGSHARAARGRALQGEGGGGDVPKGASPTCIGVGGLEEDVAVCVCVWGGGWALKGEVAQGLPLPASRQP